MAKERLNPGWLWVLAAFLIASPRLFDAGMSMDPALYASIARTFSREWNWWSLRASPQLFQQYFEHPFLFPWLQGIVFYIFGASHLTARLPALFLGTCSFYFIYRIGELWVDRKFGTILAFVTFLTINFVGSIANPYLEVPLTFFMLGALFFFSRSLHTGQIFDELWAGLFLGLAFLTKGFAALPMMGMLGCLGLYEAKFRIRKLRKVAIGWSVGVGVFLIFLALQNHFGTYPFYKYYFLGTFIDRTLNPGLNVGPWLFLKRLLEHHPIHLLLALGSPLAIRKFTKLKKAWIFGIVGSVVFIVANAVLGVPYRHYYFPLYPILNILTACTVYGFASTHMRWDLQRVALGIGIAVSVFWHLVPFQLRKRVPIDFYQMASYATALRKEGVSSLETLGIDEQNWAYREFSLWYWDLDSVILKTIEEVQGRVVLMNREDPKLMASQKNLEEKGFLLCARSPKYFLWVTPPLKTACMEAPLNPELLK